jgi:hypothetical protein
LSKRNFVVSSDKNIVRPVRDMIDWNRLTDFGEDAMAHEIYRVSSFQKVAPFTSRVQ